MLCGHSQKNKQIKTRGFPGGMLQRISDREESRTREDKEDDLGTDAGGSDVTTSACLIGFICCFGRRQLREGPHTALP